MLTKSEWKKRLLYWWVKRKRNFPFHLPIHPVEFVAERLEKTPYEVENIKLPELSKKLSEAIAAMPWEEQLDEAIKEHLDSLKKGKTGS